MLKFFSWPSITNILRTSENHFRVTLCCQYGGVYLIKREMIEPIQDTQVTLEMALKDIKAILDRKIYGDIIVEGSPKQMASVKLRELIKPG